VQLVVLYHVKNFECKSSIFQDFVMLLLFVSAQWSLSSLSDILSTGT
jgi:hypothetical protein